MARSACTRPCASTPRFRIATGPWSRKLPRSPRTSVRRPYAERQTGLAEAAVPLGAAWHRRQRPHAGLHRRGRSAGRWRGAAAGGETGGARAHEHMAVHRLVEQVPQIAEAVDDVARAAHWPVLHEADQGPVATWAFGHHTSWDDRARSARVSS